MAVLQERSTIAWTLRNRAFAAAIVGARNAEQVEMNIRAAETQLSDEEIEQTESTNVQEPELIPTT